MSVIDVSGMFSRPRSRASFRFFFIDSPSVAIDAALGDGHVGDLLDPVDVAGEAGDDDPALGVGGEDRPQRLRHRRLGAGVARLLGVGGVGQQQAHALLDLDGADAAEVGVAAVDRREVELPVARVQDHALRRVERGGEAVGHRVGDGDELDVERADHPALAVVRRPRTSVRPASPASSMRLRAKPSVSAEP